MRIIPFYCVFVVLFAHAVFAAYAPWVRRDVPAGKPLNLRAFGGPDLDLIVFSREISTIGTRIIDRSRTVQRTVTDIYGVSRIVDVPYSITRIVPKKNGVPVDGRLSEAYLIFEHPESELKVFFYDTLDTKQNEYALLVSAERSYESATAAISSLSDPEKLAVLNVEDRSIAPRFQKIVYWLAVAESQGMTPRNVLSEALRVNGTDAGRRDLATEMITVTYERAKQEEWLTPENLELMRRGQSGVVPFGRYRGQKIEVDHIVPISRYPQYGNELANLQLLPSSANEAKGATMTPGSIQLLSLLEPLPPLTSGLTEFRSPVPDAFWQSPIPQPTPAEIPRPKLDDPQSSPGWSVIGDSLFYRGNPLTDQVTRDAAAWGLDRKLFIQERVWMEKQRLFGANQTDEYEQLKELRLRGRTAREKTIIERLRARILRRE